MNQIISTKLAILFTFVFAFGVAFFLLKFNEKVTEEMIQSDEAYLKMIEDQSFEMRKNINSRALTNVKK